MLLTSRSFIEYLAMFDLAPSELAGRRVIDVAAGASDFTARAAAAGALSLAIDSAYADGLDRISESVVAGTVEGLAIVDAHADRFTWQWYGDRPRRDALRRSAREAFEVDLARRSRRYVAGALPRLPLADQSADLVLCSHLLFTWSDRLDQRWHHDAIVELARVGREVRIFPLVVHGTGDPVGWLPALLADLSSIGYAVARRQVPYEFQVGANEMLVVQPPTGATH